MRIYHLLKNEFDIVKDSERLYENYMNKKHIKRELLLSESFLKSEKSKFEYLLEKLTKMLLTQEAYNEKTWQINIIDILKIIFPKYIHVLPEVPVSDYHNNKKRKIDFLLVDFNGNIDIIEIKRPSDNQIISDSNNYRENYLPLRELSGSIMQIEKYLFHLNKGGKTGEEKINNYFHKHIDSKMNIKIINPLGIIIIGRDKGLNENQINDFEVIKRKYKNIVDIITYDDLIRRLEQLIIKYSE